MSYHHLNENERYVISHLWAAHFSFHEIGRRLGRDHTTILREVKRARERFPYAAYGYDWAQSLASSKAHQPRHFRKQSCGRLVHYVETKLKLGWPPEAISHRLRLDFPEENQMRISHETLYRWIYLDATVDGSLYRNLRRGHKRRRKQRRYGTGKRFIAGRTGIHQRPKIVEQRQRFGDWEGDTVQGKPGKGCLVTLVERKSRYLVAAKLEDKKAATLTAKSLQALGPILRVMRQTLTVDNGSEFAHFKELENKARLKVFFADPYAAWQRGLNENTNGLLRQYFPKGINFQKVSEAEVNEAVRKLNNRPRKCLGYRTPQEVFWKNSRGALAT